MAGPPSQQLEGVPEGRYHGGERFGGAALAAGKVKYQGPTSNAGEAAREHRHRRAGQPGAAHLLAEPRHLVVELQGGGLGRHVARTEAGAAGGDDEVGARLPNQRADLVRLIRDQMAAGDLDPRLLQEPRHGRSAKVLSLPRRAAVADGDHPGGWRFQTPLLPPLFSSSRTDSNQTPGSRPLTMSISVRPETAAAVSASISTPVRPVTRAVAMTRTPS